MDYLIELEPVIRTMERERQVERARVCREAGLGSGHPLLASTGHLLTRIGTRLECWAEPRPAPVTWPAPRAGQHAKEASTPC